MRDCGGSAVALNGRVAYVSQKAWIVSDTVRGNILFGAAFDPARYAAAVHFACLKADL
jgi:ABC-type multidrug transport system fused ATPase/permease subunit